MRSFGGGPVRQAPFRVGPEAVGSLGDYIRRTKVDSVIPPSDHFTEREKGAVLLAEHPVPAGFLAYCLEQGFDDESLKEHLVKVASISPGVAADFDAFFTKAALGLGSLGTAWNNFKNWASPPIQTPKVNVGGVVPKPAPAGVPASLASKMDAATGASHQPPPSQLSNLAARGMNTATGLAYGTAGTLAAGIAGGVEGLGHVDRALGGNHIDPNTWADVRRNVWRGQNAGWEDVTRNLDPRQDVRWETPTAVNQHNAANDSQLRAMGQHGAANVAWGAQGLAAGAADAIPVAALGGVTGVNAAIGAGLRGVGGMAARRWANTSAPVKWLAGAAATTGPFIPAQFEAARTSQAERNVISENQEAYRAERAATAAKMQSGEYLGVQYPDGTVAYMKNPDYAAPQGQPGQQPSQPQPAQPQQPAGQGTVLREVPPPQQPQAASQQAGIQLPPAANAEAIKQMSPEQAESYRQYGEQKGQELLKQWETATPEQRDAMQPQIEEASRAKILGTCYQTGQDPVKLYQQGLEGKWTAEDLQRNLQVDPEFARQALASGDPVKFFKHLSTGQQIGVSLGLGMGLVGLLSSVFGNGGFMGLLMSILGIGGAAAGAGLFDGVANSLMPAKEQEGPPAEAVSPETERMNFFADLSPEMRQRAYRNQLNDQERQELDEGARALAPWQSGPRSYLGRAYDFFGAGPNAELAARAKQRHATPEALRRALEARISMGGLG